MKTRALGFLLMAVGACTYAVGCGSSGNGGGTGGKTDGGGMGGAGGMGTGGKATGGSGMGGAGMGGKDGGAMDAPADLKGDTGGGDTPTDTQQTPTFGDVFAILSNITTPTADTAPGCIHCHDGVTPDGSTPKLPHSMDFTTKAAAYAALFNVDSIRCAGSDAGADASAALKRVLAGNAAQSVLWQKLNQGVNPSMHACDDGPGMPLNPPMAIDGGPDAGDAGFTMTHYAITAQQLATVMGWINAGAPNN